jgi:para-aminobenzoate synthetase component 1
LIESHVSRLPYRDDPSVFYQQIRDLPWPVWLDSGFPYSGGGRYDIIAADPYVTLWVKNGCFYRQATGERAEQLTGDPLEHLQHALGARVSAPEGLPFGGGAIGFLGYDLARILGELPARQGLPEWPDMAIGLYDWCLLVDHARRRCHFVAQGRDPRPQPGWPFALRRLLAMDKPLAAVETVRGELVEDGMTPSDYADRFARIQHYIRAGDCYQVNLAQRYCVRSADDSWALYRRMRADNPAPYGAFLEYPFGQVMSSSPELFIRLRGRRVETRPIKGTRPRGETAEEDAALRIGLAKSTKDRAENLMIVDLLRNDLGKVCVPGSIEVPGLFEIESFATVHHLVSTVMGTLRSGLDAVDLLRACFPGGSITGAPKRRAMEVIDELEPSRREVYCGNLVRLGFDGNLDSSIAIRTALKQGERLYYWAGGGIVADSDCAAEYQECLDKAAAFFRLLSVVPDAGTGSARHAG